MKKTIVIIMAILTASLAHSAAADTLKLKNGQVHEGTITAEEAGRIQIKLKGSGARLWFSRDQILEFEKTSPGKSEEKNVTPTKPADASASLDDDVTRAQALLDKMRAEQPDLPHSKKKNDKNAVKTAPKKDDQPGQKVDLVPYTDADIEALIDQLRNAPVIYDRRNACIELGKAEAVQAIPHLIHVLDDETPMMRKEANEALIKITGQDFGFNPVAKRNVRVWAIEQWEDWYKEIKDEDAKKTLRSLF